MVDFFSKGVFFFAVQIFELVEFIRKNPLFTQSVQARFF